MDKFQYEHLKNYCGLKRWNTECRWWLFKFFKNEVKDDPYTNLMDRWVIDWLIQRGYLTRDIRPLEHGYPTLVNYFLTNKGIKVAQNIDILLESGYYRLRSRRIGT